MLTVAENQPRAATIVVANRAAIETTAMTEAAAIVMTEATEMIAAVEDEAVTEKLPVAVADDDAADGNPALTLKVRESGNLVPGPSLRFAEAISPIIPLPIAPWWPGQYEGTAGSKPGASTRIRHPESRKQITGSFVTQQKHQRYRPDMIL